MKRTIPLFCILFGLLYINSTAAQIHISINASANIVSQPVWGPTGYDYARYYYMPDIDAYYSVSNRTFVYQEGGRWAYGASLPERFHYDLYHGYKVVVNEPKPYLHAEVYRNKYSQYRGQGNQEAIRDSRDSRYYIIRNHPMHGQWHGGRPGGNDHGRPSDDRRHSPEDHGRRHDHGQH